MILTRPENLTTIQQRKLYELCWEFEESWNSGNHAPLQEWVARAGDIPADILLLELSETKRELEEKAASQFRSMPSVADDRYEFVEEIARGGAAVVWRVRDRHLRRETAIKYLLDSNDNRDMRARLEREARLCARLVHPGIVPIHELSSFTDQRPFVSMKLVEGKTLLQLLEAQTHPLSKSQLKTFEDIFTKTCEAMAFAHQKGIIHRDIKPGNIMVGSFGEVQIMDWGLAKELTPASPDEDAHPAITDTVSDDCSRGTVSSLDDTQKIINVGEQTVIGSVIGTIAYMSPEQARGEIDLVEQRSDVFALGAVLCRILTGHAPYNGADQKALLLQAQRGELKNAFELLSSSKHRRLASVATACLAVDPAARPADAGAVVALLKSIRSREQQRQSIVRFAAVCIVAATVTLAILLLSKLGDVEAKPQNSPELSAVAVEPPESNDLDVQSFMLELQGAQRKQILDEYPKMLKLAPKNEELFYFVAVTLLNNRRYEEAEQVANELIKLNPTNAEFPFVLAQILYRQAKFEASEAALLESKRLREAGSMTASPIEERLERIKLALEIARQGDAFAIADYQAFDSDNLFIVAQICELLGRMESAIELNNMALSKMEDIELRSLSRHHLLVTAGAYLAKDSLTENARNALCRAVRTWLEEQFELGCAAIKSADDQSADDQSASDENAQPKRTQALLSTLKFSPELQPLRSIADDSRVAPDIRDGIRSTFKAIDDQPSH